MSEAAASKADADALLADWLALGQASLAKLHRAARPGDGVVVLVMIERQTLL